MSDLEFLINRWHNLVARLNLFSAQPILNNLIQRYGQPHRAYHNLKHIEALLKLLPEETELEFAAWFHDAIYDPKRNDNEEQSAALAEQQLTSLGIDQTLIGRVAGLILATKTHQTNDALMALFVDADLSILGAEPQTYDAYARAIRREYAWVSEADYHAGRSRVLQNFLKRERIFQTDMFEGFEAKARENMERELKGLC